MRRIRKKYQSPKHLWQGERIKEEIQLAKEYGLANKKEIWKLMSLLRNWRAQARKITGMLEGREESEKMLINKLQKLGVLGDKADLDDVLDLDLRSVAEKRLQTIVFKQGLASSPRQARQFIVHGKITINNGCVTSPSYWVKSRDRISFIEGFNPQIKQRKKAEKSKIEKKPEEKIAEVPIEKNG